MKIRILSLTSLSNVCHTNISGNHYRFAPDLEVNLLNPCDDLSVMKLAAQFECATEFSNVLIGSDTCRWVRMSVFKLHCLGFSCHCFRLLNTFFFIYSLIKMTLKWTWLPMTLTFNDLEFQWPWLSMNLTFNDLDFQRTWLWLIYVYKSLILISTCPGLGFPYYEVKVKPILYCVHKYKSDWADHFLF